MMGRRHGGLERAAVDLHEALTLIGCEVISHALERLIRDPELRRRMGAAARRRVVRFDLPVVGEEYRRALAELATSQGTDVS